MKAKKTFVITKIYSRKVNEGYYNIMSTDVVAAYQEKADAIAKVERCLEKTREVYGGIITQMWDEDADWSFEKVCYASKLESDGEKWQMNITRVSMY